MNARQRRVERRKKAAARRVFDRWFIRKMAIDLAVEEALSPHHEHGHRVLTPEEFVVERKG